MQNHKAKLNIGNRIYEFKYYLQIEIKDKGEYQKHIIIYRGKEIQEKSVKDAISKLVKIIENEN